MYYTIVTNKYNIGDVYWRVFEGVIREHMMNNFSKFFLFSTVVKCKIDNEDVSISVSGIDNCVPLYKFDNGDWFYYRYCNRKKNPRLYVSSR